MGVISTTDVDSQDPYVIKTVHVYLMCKFLKCYIKYFLCPTLQYACRNMQTNTVYTTMNSNMNSRKQLFIND